MSISGLAPMSSALRPLAGALVLAFGAVGAQAQSLSEVVQAARSVDATYLGARSSADAAHFRYEQARSVHLPTAGLQVQAAHNDSNSPQLGVTASGPTAIKETVKTNSLGASPPRSRTSSTAPTTSASTRRRRTRRSRNRSWSKPTRT